MNKNDFSPETFSLIEGGPIHKLLVKLNMDQHRWKLALIFLCITWLPLVVITAINGTLYNGAGLNFLEDYTMQGRLLIGIPMMILIKNIVYSKIPMVLHYISEVLMHPGDREQFIQGALQKAKNRSDSIWREILLLAMVIAIAISPIKGATVIEDRTGPGSWLASPKEGEQLLSLAGYWVRYISVPVFQYLLFGWLWRYTAWIMLLFRISRIKLKLQPTHPDSSGGLGIILLAQRNFNLPFIAFGSVISCALISNMLHDGVSFEMIRVELTGYIILSIILLLFPLFFFCEQLIDTKIKGKMDLSRAGIRLSHKFEEEWVKPLRLEDRVAEDAVDSSIQVDYYSNYEYLQQFRIVPITFRDVVLLALMLFVPFIPIFFIHFSITDLLQKLIGMLV